MNRDSKLLHPKQPPLHIPVSPLPPEAKLPAGKPTPISYLAKSLSLNLAPRLPLLLKLGGVGQGME